MPAINNFLVDVSLFVGVLFFFDRYQTNGNKTAEPIKNLAALKRNGPIVSMPSRCATNANPHIAAARSIMRSALITLFFIISLS